MADIALSAPRSRRLAPAARDARIFFAICLAIIAMAATLAAAFPIGFSIATVFCFAGPHNWFEARYFLRRMPGRFGPLAGYFAWGIGGVLALAAGFVGLVSIADRIGPGVEVRYSLLALWCTIFTLWVAWMAHLRSRINPVRDSSWVWPAACFLIALAWIAPLSWALVLVYLHPLVALFLLDREIGRMRPGWRTAYRASLGCAALGLLAIVSQLYASPPLAEADPLAWRITHHAGAGILTSVSSHLLVAAHTYLEMLHYAVWLLAIPALCFTQRAWQVDELPLARRPAWRAAIQGLLITGLAVVVILWVGFTWDYAFARDVYFAVATVHVLAEIPFLLRLV